MALTRKQIQELKQQLIDEKKALEKQFEHNDNFGLTSAHSVMAGELSTYDNHPADTASELYEREKDIALNEHAEFHLDDIMRALEDIEIGHYGTCKKCGKDIPFERLQAVPTTEYCIEHAREDYIPFKRPVEEEFENPPFGRTSLDEHEDTQFDGEDAWQIVERWGNSDSPAMAEDPEIHDYEELTIEADESEGYVEDIESFLATDIYGNNVTVIRNEAYQRYMLNNEGDHLLEPEYLTDTEEDDEYLIRPF
jgi:YteA family regulatory protein